MSPKLKLADIDAHLEIFHSFSVKDYDGETMLEIARIFESKEFSKAQYTRAELHELFTGAANDIIHKKAHTLAFTNPDRDKPLEVTIYPEGASQSRWNVIIEDKKIEAFDSEDEAKAFVDAALRNPMMWRN